MNKDYINGYKQGYKEGKRDGKELAGFVLGKDIIYIVGNLALVLNEKGMGTDEIEEVMTKMQAMWEANLLQPKEFTEMVKEKTGVEFALKEDTE